MSDCQKFPFLARDMVALVTSIAITLLVTQQTAPKLRHWSWSNVYPYNFNRYFLVEFVWPIIQMYRYQSCMSVSIIATILFYLLSLCKKLAIKVEIMYTLNWSNKTSEFCIVSTSNCWLVKSIWCRLNADHVHCIAPCKNFTFFFPVIY
jgi:hypothetical protein